jgi:hypothetical protein
MALSTHLKNTVRAGVVALALGGTAVMGVAPAQAAPPNFGFSLQFGNQTPHGGVFLNFGDRDYFKYCLSDRQIESGLRKKGYRNIQEVREERRTNKVWYVARKSGDWYQLRVDRCTGKVDRVREINRRGNGSFTLNFSF